MSVNSFDSYYMSWVPQKSNDHTPLYKSFAEQLEQAILSGSLAPNTLLPPQRELADYLDVNLSTITKAYKICEKKGYIYAVIGKGTFVSPNALLYNEKKDFEQSQVNMRTIEPFHISDEFVRKAIERIVKRPHFNELLSYQLSDLSHSHRTTAAAYLHRLNIPAQASNIIICAGSQNALTIVMLSLFQSGDYIAVDTFTYHHFKMLANYLGIRLYPVGGDKNGMKPEALQGVCKRYQIKGIYLMPSCSNPTAIEMPASRRLELVKVIEQFGLTVIEDDSFRFLSNLGNPSFYELLPDQTVYINSTSKSISSGIRLAYLLYPSRLGAKLIYGEKAANLHYTCFNAEIVSELINSGDYENIQSTKKELARQRNMMYDSIVSDKSRASLNPYSFFRWYDVGANNKALIEKLAAENIVVMESQMFNAGSTDSDHYIRIALSSEADDELLAGALREIVNFQKKTCNI